MSTYDVEIWPNKKKMKLVYGTMLTVLGLCIIGMILSQIYWDDFVETRQTILTGKIVQTGWPITVFWWSAGLTFFGVLAFALMYASTDRKTPALAVNKNGLYVNQQLWKKAFITWDEIERLEWVSEGNQAFKVYLKDAMAVINRNPGMTKPFLKQTYVTTPAPINFDNKFTAGDLEKLAKLAEGYYAGG